MPDEPESKPAVDLSDLRLMPKWVADFSKAAPSKFADMPEEDHRDRRGPRDGGGRGRRDGGGGGFRGERRDSGGGFRGERGAGPPRGDRKPFDKPFAQRGGERRDDRGGPRGDRRGGGDRGGFRGRDDRDRGPRPEAPPMVQGLATFIEPEKKAIEALATTIRAAGKAFSVFDAARLVLQSGDRFHVKFSIPPDSAVKLCTIPADGSVWLGREEAVSHFLHSEGIKDFYRVEEIELEEPKGVFTNIAVCGMTGEMLGPTSHHSYQAALHRIHHERFSDMRFEDYKRRVRTENSPEIIEKWKDSQKRGQVWVYLTPALEEGVEPLKLKSRGEMEAHFRQTHADSLVHETAEAWVPGNIPRQNLSPALYHALRRSVDDARKHLLPVAQLLCSGFEGHGLKLFKRRGGKLWVSRTRPRALDSSVVLSDRIARMLEIVKSKPGIAVKELIELVAPAAERKSARAQPEAGPVDDAMAVSAEAPAVTEAAATPAAEGPAPASKQEPEARAAAQTPAAPQQEWSAEQLHALQDLHWLNSEGYVIQYSDGIVFIGVTEPPPPKPKAVKPAESAPVADSAPAADAPTITDTMAVADATLEAPRQAPGTGEIPIEDVDDGPAAEPFSFMDDPMPDATEEVAPDPEHA